MAKQHPLVIRLFLASLWAFLCHAIDVYSADSRPFSTIQASRGMLPKGLSTVGVVSADISLWNHVHGGSDNFSKDEDGYVSTTSDSNLAANWVKWHFGGNGYIYRIHSAPNMIDCQVTLGKYNPYNDEKEFAALGGIKINQIIGWTPVRNNFKGKEKLNPLYRAATYSNMGNGGAQPQLAAFPPDHEAWAEAPWSQYSTCRRSAREFFMKKRACSPAKSNQAFATEYLEYVNAICPACE
ncbi:cholera enterotoxin subunit A [Colletotrichum spaethianum]|uniref:Cholera enterotoxin subunit A n=1 Tax=Colletotrichum spaethianum TaxID=700344 RepID=A0AA37LEA8_9PEZI|nr:cholera enterotoxin subunit A [Colletotrichum spaethianum]GKT44955.1 cholera enterotoxin subunit A [Colletotrichum spaethianum]